MRVSYVVAIVLRLFSIYWIVRAAVGILGGAGGALSMWSPGDPHALSLIIFLLGPSFYVVLAGLAWFAAGRISRVVVGSEDREIGFHQIQPHELYTLGLLIVGAIYFLENFAQVFNWVHYLMFNHEGQALFKTDGQSPVYKFSNTILPCAGGAVLACMSPKLGRRLASFHQQPEAQETTSATSSSS